LFYSYELFGSADPELVALAERTYDRILVCAPDFAFVQDGTRRDEAFRERGHRWYLSELARRGISWDLVQGDLPTRVQMAWNAVMGAHLPV
jgi:nicotinamide riboside kinase